MAGSLTVRGGVRALLFDVFGTVVDWRGGLLAQMRVFGAARGVEGDWEGLVDAWRGAYVPSMAQVRDGTRPFVTLDTLQAESLAALAPRFGLGMLDAAAQGALVRMWHMLPPWPDSVAGLNRLRQHYIIAPLSNGHVALLVTMAKAAGLPWDMVFGADLFGHYKPDPETYRGAAALLGCAPEEVMLVAAHPSDLDAAAACGLRTAHIARPMEYGPGRAAPLPDPGRYTLALPSLEALADDLTR